MVELISVVSLFFGVPLLIIGWVWSIVRARSVDIKWLLALIFLFPFSLVAFCLVHWQKARYPMLVSVIGLILTFITFYFTAEQ